MAFSADEMKQLLDVQSKIESLHDQIHDAEAIETDLIDRLMSHLEDRDCSKMELHGFEVEFVKGSPFINWKQQFIHARGNKAAELIESKAPKPPTLKIRKL